MTSSALITALVCYGKHLTETVYKNGWGWSGDLSLYLIRVDKLLVKSFCPTSKCGKITLAITVISNGYSAVNKAKVLYALIIAESDNVVKHCEIFQCTFSVHNTTRATQSTWKCNLNVTLGSTKMHGYIDDVFADVISKSLATAK